MIKSLFFIFIALLLVAGGVFLFINQNESPTPPPAFSNYAEYDSVLIEKSDTNLQYSFYPTEFINNYQLYPTSELNDEMDRLSGLTSQRTPENQVVFEKEYEDIRDIAVGNNKTLYDYIGRLQKPLTYEIYKSLSHDLQIIVANEKLKHNVARPMHMNLSINSPVKTPDTPAYPSMFAARTMLVDSILKRFLPEEEYKSVSLNLEAAINRSKLFGISTKFDTEYGSALARSYTDSMFDKVLSKEFIQTVQEKEWSGSSTWPPELNYGEESPDLLIYNPRVEQNNKQLVFKTDITNQGAVSTPPEFKILLEIDQYADGSVDEKIDIPYGLVTPGASREAGYTLSYPTPGNHSFRFVVNPDYSFYEWYHQNNYGEWVGFTIE